ncbi:hypothetical protein Sjap_008996 [Stephania japonica]|uniref:Uncharacterized protein n=1 Tax=Stephania japonica TaxID=461633 RepID=A0AAP0JQQ0_9MAGN
MISESALRHLPLQLPSLVESRLKCLRKRITWRIGLSSNLSCMWGMTMVEMMANRTYPINATSIDMLTLLKTRFNFRKFYGYRLYLYWHFASEENDHVRFFPLMLVFSHRYLPLLTTVGASKDGRGSHSEEEKESESEERAWKREIGGEEEEEEQQHLKCGEVDLWLPTTRSKILVRVVERASLRIILIDRYSPSRTEHLRNNEKANVEITTSETIEIVHQVPRENDALTSSSSSSSSLVIPPPQTGQNTECMVVKFYELKENVGVGPEQETHDKHYGIDFNAVPSKTIMLFGQECTYVYNNDTHVQDKIEDIPNNVLVDN